jgi:DNA-directed RNA polymerase subunit RPC12/RpoP
MTNNCTNCTKQRRRIVELVGNVDDSKVKLDAVLEGNAQLNQWVKDLHSGMYINCVYCGHRYGPKDEVPTSMADVLKAHVEKCPKHPMSALKKEVERLEKENTYYKKEAWRHAQANTRLRGEHKIEEKS